MIIFLFLFICSLSTISAADQNINNSSTISSGINSTGDRDTLTLQEGIYNKSGDYGITINQSLTIRGNTSTNKVIIDATKNGRIFTIGNNLNVTFINLTFANGNHTDGGAIYNNNPTTTLTFINCTFINNTVTYSGGAVCNFGGNVSIIGSNFINNNASNGGAVYNTGTMSITGSSFINANINYSAGVVVLCIMLVVI
jgi:predicted outer membrane repeat protein